MLEADVVVVGSGAGGGVVAARLAEAGRSVLVIEAGPYRPEAEMPTLEARAMQELYLDQGTTATSDLGVTILAGSGLGGGTTINWTTAIAPPDWLRQEWEEKHGLEGLAGRRTDEILARLRAELDLRPPSVIPPKDRVILDGARALGWEAAATERNAGPCVDCGACGFGCRAGTKRSGLRAHLAMAARSGARVLVDARVERIEIAGGRAHGVRGIVRGADGRPRPFRVAAPQVVVAAGALRTPLLLRASGIDHPQLGRNLRLHPVVAVGAEMPDPVEMWLGPTQAARSLEFWRPGPPDPAGIGPAHGGFVIESAPPHPGLLASAFAWEGAAAAAERMDRAAYQVPLIGIIRDVGSGHVRCDPPPPGTDRLSAERRGRTDGPAGPRGACPPRAGCRRARGLWRREPRGAVSVGIGRCCVRRLPAPAGADDPQPQPGRPLQRPPDGQRTGRCGPGRASGGSLGMGTLGSQRNNRARARRRGRVAVPDRIRRESHGDRHGSRRPGCRKRAVERLRVRYHMSVGPAQIGT